MQKETSICYSYVYFFCNQLLLQYLCFCRPDIVVFPKSYQGLTLVQAMNDVDWSNPDIIRRYTRDISKSEIVARCLYCNNNGTYQVLCSLLFDHTVNIFNFECKHKSKCFWRISNQQLFYRTHLFRKIIN